MNDTSSLRPVIGNDRTLGKAVEAFLARKMKDMLPGRANELPPQVTEMSAAECLVSMSAAMDGHITQLQREIEKTANNLAQLVGNSTAANKLRDSISELDRSKSELTEVRDSLKELTTSKSELSKPSQVEKQKMQEVHRKFRKARQAVQKSERTIQGLSASESKVQGIAPALDITGLIGKTFEMMESGITSLMGMMGVKPVDAPSPSLPSFKPAS